MTLLHLRDYVAPGQAFHLGRRATAGGFRGTMHTHDFAELLWLERGSLTHLINRARARLREGDVVFIRPTDVHTFRAAAGEPSVMRSLTFSRETLASMRRRYAGDLEWPWRKGPQPLVRRLDEAQHARLGELTALLAMRAPTRLLLERFLLEVLHDLAAPPLGPRVPPWLSDALDRFSRDPDALAEGVAGLAALGGRSREHVSRVIKERTGRSATSLVNEVRLTRAAAALKLTDDPIPRIALDSGVASLSHFYRLFRARYGVTPRRYRLEHQSPILGSQIGASD